MKRLSFLIAFASLMLFSFGLAHAATEITLDNMTGLLSETGDSVIAGASVRWNLRLTYTPGDGSVISGSTNGFEVYTHLGGTHTDNFTAITYDTFSWGWPSIFDLTQGLILSDFSVDGVGADTVGFGGAKIMGSGIVDGTDALCWWIETTPCIDSDTLCIDSAYYPPAGEWLWATDGPLEAFSPDWGGPYCFHVYDTGGVAANLVLSDTVLNFSAVEGGSNPAGQTFTVSSDVCPLDFTLSNDSAWLSTDPTSGMTEDTIMVSIDILDLGVGTYTDTIEVSSTTALNSPQYVEVNLEVTPNNPPVLDPIGPQVVDEGENLNFNVTAFDPDGDSIILTVDTLFLGMSFTDLCNDTGTFDWTPNFDQAGVYLVNFIASDGVLADSELVEITVNDVNSPPVLDSIRAKEVDEWQNLNFFVTASDPDGDSIALEIDTLYEGMTFNDNGNDTGTFDWTPNFDQAGVYYMTFIASDGELADSEVVEITVNNTNRPPEIDPVADTTIDECDTLELAFSVTDPDGDSIALEIDTLYENMTFTDHGNGTAELTFAPDFDQAGTYPLTLYAADSLDSAFITFTIEVKECFNLVVSPDTLHFTAVEGGTSPDPDSFAVSEIGGGAIAFTLAETSGWFDLDKTSGTTPEDVEVSVDITGLTADTYFDSVTVSSGEADNSPVYQFISLLLVDSMSHTFTVDSVAAIPGGEVVVPVEFVNLHDLEYIWVRLDWDSDYLTLDSVSFADSRLDFFPIKWDSIRNDLNFVQLKCYDSVVAPGTGNFVNLHFYIDAGTPPGFYDIVRWICTVPPCTLFNPYFIVRPGPDEILYLEPHFTPGGIEVAPPENNPPVLDPIADTVVNEGENLNFLVTASDPDGDSIALEIDTLYEGMTFVDNGNDTGTFDWTPNFDQAGVYYVIFIASDGFLADSELVEITVNNTNRPPLVDQPCDTIIDECDTLELIFSATDPDGDSITIEVDTLYENMTFDDNGDGTAGFYFAPSFEQAGTYTLTVYASDGMDTDSVTFTITVEECEPPPECVDMILSDTVFHFVDTLEYGDKSGSVLIDTLSITSSDDEFCFVIYPYLDTTSSWLTLSDTTGCTPAAITLTADGSGMNAGNYQNMYAVLGDSTVCDPNPQYFTVILEVVDTTTPPPPAGDTLTVATVPAVPGAQVIVPVDFVNQCDLIGILAWLKWYSDYLVLDSVSWVDTRLHEFVIKTDSIFNDSNAVFLLGADDTAIVLPGYGNFVNLHFSVAMGTPAGFYEIDLKPIGLPEHPAFTVICDEGIEIIEPQFIPGGIVVDTSGNFVCGYVVDPDGIPIPGATVELWVDFPYGPPEDMTTTNGTGVFAFSDFTVVPFDLYAYHEGYYPGLVENINFSQIGIMIVLAPVEEVYPSYEWVNFYCDYNTLMDEPLPVGSVVDAYDPDDVHCGTFFVTEAGKYGFMPVYRDDPSEPGDQGASPGDIIRFFVNGTEAVATGDRIWTESSDAHEVCLEAGIIITKTCDLVEGWNLVSWNVDHESDYILDALGSIEGYIELVLGFEQGGLTYDPDLPMFSTLWYVDHLSGYWIKTSCDVTLEITGAPVPATTPITVTTGWNLVSYLPDFTLATEDALASIHDDLIVALGYDGEALTYIPGEEPYNTLTEMSSCFGYWIKITQAGELVYPATGPVIASSQKNDNPVMSAAVPGVTATSRWVNVYAHNLTLDGETISAGATIAAYTLDGTKIGAFAMKQDGLFGFMPVYADDNATSEVEGVRAGERFYLSVNGVETNETFAWTKAGDKMEIGALTAKTNSGQALPDRYSLHQNYPNPFNPTTNIGFTLPVSGKARIDIFNILGKLVATPFDGIAQAGANEVVWNGRNFTGETVATGIYFYRLTADNYVETKKMTLMK